MQVDLVVRGAGIIYYARYVKWVSLLERKPGAAIHAEYINHKHWLQKERVSVSVFANGIVPIDLIILHF